MNNNIISTGDKVFQKFLSQLTSDLTKPNAKFIQEFLCGVLFSDNLVLTNIAAKVPCASKLTAIAKRFRRQLAINIYWIDLLRCSYADFVRVFCTK